MCGRFTLTKPNLEKLESTMNIDLPPLVQGRYNIAPAQQVAAIRAGFPGTVTPCTWGFTVAHGSPVINARIESLREKKMFSELVGSKRCVVLADGFYEWKNAQPYYFRLPGHALFAFAGLWRPRPDGPGRDECVVITREASREVRPVHTRIPVILTMEEWAGWLDNLKPPGKPPALDCIPVSRRVNRVANDDPACIEPALTQSELFPGN